MIFKHKKVYQDLQHKQLMQGAYGGGREGVQRAEYQSASDRNRAALQAQLLQSGLWSSSTGSSTKLFNESNEFSFSKVQVY
jgi:hypothetical protein